MLIKTVELQERERPTGNYLRAVSAIAWKDLSAELRSRELLSAMLVFSLLVILIFYFALELDVKARNGITAGALWVTFAFAGTLGLNRSMAVEKDRGCLDGRRFSVARFFDSAEETVIETQLGERHNMRCFWCVFWDVRTRRLTAHHTAEKAGQYFSRTS